MPREEIEESEKMDVNSGVTVAHRTGVALVPDAHSGVVLKWTLQNAVEKNGELLLFHVRAPLRTIPTPVGNVPVSQVSNEKLLAHMAVKNAKTNRFSDELLNNCARYQVKAEFVLVEGNDVGKSLVEQISKYQLSTFILGASRSNLLRLKTCVSDYARKHAPDNCTVHCISKSSRLVTSRNTSAAQSLPRARSSPARPELSPARSSSSVATRSSSDSFVFPFSPAQWLETDHGFRDGTPPVSLSPVATRRGIDEEEITEEITEEVSYQPATPESTMAQPNFQTNEQQELPESSPPSCCSYTESDVDEILPAESMVGSQDEVKLLKEELQYAILAAKKARERYDAEAIRSQEARDKANWDLKRAEMLMRVVEEEKQRQAETARKIAEESQKHADALLLADSLRKALEAEIQTRKQIELQLKAEAEKEANRQQLLKYTQFSFEELRAITDNFCEQNKLGEGSYGHVFKGTLHRTCIAVKVLRHDSWQGPQEFQQEVEVLSRLHHPHIVLLLGGNPEKKCLVYEYLENGSLEDRLFGKDDSPPIPNFTRYQIAVEVGTALLFLHRARPHPIVLRDLKPSNILLDRNYKSKISDVGLARFMPGDQTSVKGSSPVGTFAYIDPEYQRLGSFNAKSDVFAFGIILLQLLTATSPVGIIHKVATAVDSGHLVELLDSSAGEWPLAAATQLACIGLSCAEVQRTNRPELESVLEMLDAVRDLFLLPDGCCHRSKAAVPPIFLCPILQEVMEYPVIASDGYTYEYDAILRWLERSDASPMTNLRLETKTLTPNRVVRSAICEWRAANAAIRVGV